MSDIEYSVKTSDVIKSFDCITQGRNILVKLGEINWSGGIELLFKANC